MQRSAFVLVGGLVAVLAAGCGGGGESESTNPTPTFKYPTEDSFCAAVAEAECNTAVVTACYGSDSTTLPDDKKSCVEARKATCNPGKLPYHPEKAEGCVAARGSAVSDAVWSHDEIAAVADACLLVFSKQLGEGAVCSTNADCDAAKDLRCVVKLGSLEGICAVPKSASGGQSCSDPAVVCDEGFYCDPKVSHCLENPGDNEMCSAAAPCASEYYCTSPDDGTCAVKTKNGADCTADGTCAGGFCVGAMEGVSGKCSSTLPLQINSSACDVYR